MGGMADSGERPGTSSETRRLIHDLRQPLAAMQMWLDLLDDALRDQVGEKELRYLTKVRAEMARLAQLLSGAAAAAPAAAPVAAAAGDAVATARPSEGAPPEIAPAAALAGVSLMV